MKEIMRIIDDGNVGDDDRDGVGQIDNKVCKY